MLLGGNYEKETIQKMKLDFIVSFNKISSQLNTPVDYKISVIPIIRFISFKWLFGDFFKKLH